MTMKAAIEYTKLDETTLSRLAKSGEIPAEKQLRQWRFEKSVLDRWLAKQAPLPVTEQLLPPDATGLAAPLTISSVITPARINLDLRSTARDAILQELVALVIPPRERRMTTVLFDALKAREDLCPTCVNEGVAIPHARNALVGVVDIPTLAYGRHRAGIDFGAMDRKPVHHFFLLCAPNVRAHLHLLARLSRLVGQPSFRKKLLGAESPEDVTGLIRVAEQTLAD